MEPDRIIAFVAAMALVELTPGPNMGYLALVGASQGRRAGFAVVAGVTVGLAAWLILAVAGIGAAVAEQRTLLTSLRVAGAAYLVWLAVEALRARVVLTGQAVAARSLTLHFLRGLGSNLLNAKAAIFYLTVTPAFVSASGGPVRMQLLMLGLIHLSISLVVHSALVLFGARMAAGALLHRRLVRLTLAVGVAASAAWLLLTPAR